MKTAEEIRKHRDDLLASARIPCTCGTTAHARTCDEGRRMIAVAARALSWVLVEEPSYDRVVERFAAGVRQL